jgi:hypothetical protein
MEMQYLACASDNASKAVQDTNLSFQTHFQEQSYIATISFFARSLRLSQPDRRPYKVTPRKNDMSWSDVSKGERARRDFTLRLWHRVRKSMAEAAEDAAEEGGATAAASRGAGVRLGTGDPLVPGLPEAARTPEARRLSTGRIRGGGERRRRPRAGGAGSRELTAIGESEVGGPELAMGSRRLRDQ